MMSRIGSYLAIFGAGSIILSFFNVEFRILMWIDSWGPTAAWAIRIGLLVLGLILIFAGRTKETSNANVEELDSGNE